MDEQENLLSRMRSTHAARNITLGELIKDVKLDWNVDVFKTCDKIKAYSGRDIHTIAAFLNAIPGVSLKPLGASDYGISFQRSQEQALLIKMIGISKPKKSRKKKKPSGMSSNMPMFNTVNSGHSYMAPPTNFQISPHISLPPKISSVSKKKKIYTFNYACKDKINQDSIVSATFAQNKKYLQNGTKKYIFEDQMNNSCTDSMNTSSKHSISTRSEASVNSSTGRTSFHFTTPDSFKAVKPINTTKTVPKKAVNISADKKYTFGYSLPKPLSTTFKKEIVYGQRKESEIQSPATTLLDSTETSRKSIEPAINTNCQPHFFTVIGDFQIKVAATSFLDSLVARKVGKVELMKNGKSVEEVLAGKQFKEFRSLSNNLTKEKPIPTFFEHYDYQLKISSNVSRQVMLLASRFNLLSF